MEWQCFVYHVKVIYIISCSFRGRHPITQPNPWTGHKVNSWAYECDPELLKCCRLPMLCYVMLCYVML